jgi:cysteine desulfurase
MNSDFVYFDHAAATPIDSYVLSRMQPYFTELFFNPSSPYAPAIEVKRDYRQAKAQLAQLLGARADELVMTSGATESTNLAFAAVDGHVVVASIEHASVLAAAKSRQSYTLVRPTKKGSITPEAVRAALTPETTLVSVALANHEIGTIQPISDISAVIERERRRRQDAGEATPLLFHTDASQAGALIDIKVKRLGVDLLTLSAAKVYGPKQVGLLWARPDVRLKSLLVGGGQEGGVRSGTENVAGVVGFAAALEVASSRRDGEVRRLRVLRNSLENRLVAAFPEMIVSSDDKKGLVSYLNISFPGVDAERLVFLLEREGVLVATGSACAANSGMRSHVLTEIGLSDTEADGSLRLTLGRLNNENDIDRAVDVITRAVRTEQERMHGA